MEFGTANIFPSDSSLLSCRPPCWFLLPSKFLSSSVVLATLGGWLEWQHFFCKLSLILTASVTKTQGDVEPGSAQQLCEILCVTFAKLAGSEKLLYWLDLLLQAVHVLDYWASFSLLCVLPTNGIEDLACSFKCRVFDNGPRLVYWWLFKLLLYCCSNCTERRNFEIFSVFLLHCGIKNFQAVI